LMVVNFVYVLVRVNSQDFEIPVRYTQYGASPVGLGEWFSLYELGIFAVAAFAMNLVLSIKVYTLSKGISKMILGLTVLLLIFLLIVSWALLGLSPSS